MTNFFLSNWPTVKEHWALRKKGLPYAFGNSPDSFTVQVLCKNQMTLQLGWSMRDHRPMAFSKRLTGHHPTETLLPLLGVDLLVDLQEQVIKRFVRSLAVIVISGGNNACLFCKALAKQEGKYTSRGLMLCGSYNNANNGLRVHVPLLLKVLCLKGQLLDTGALVAFVAAPCCHAVVPMFQCWSSTELKRTSLTASSTRSSTTKGQANVSNPTTLASAESAGCVVLASPVPLL